MIEKREGKSGEALETRASKVCIWPDGVEFDEIK